MKIFLDYKNTPSISKAGYLKLKETFSEYVWTDNLDESYGANIIVVMSSFCTNETLDRYPKLKWIQLLTAGFDKIDLDYLKARNIKLSNASDVFSIAIAEDIISKILYFNKNMKFYDNNKNKKTWEPHLVTHDISNSVVGILGAGSIGIETAKRLKAFDTKIIGYRRSLVKTPYIDEIYNDQAGFEKILKLSDYLIIALPLSESTYHIINQETLKLMKKDALLINVGRGKLINETDLITALKNNELRGAALDVTEVEPLPKTSGLWELNNVFISPHTSNLSPNTEARLVERLKENLNNELRGK